MNAAGIRGENGPEMNRITLDLDIDDARRLALILDAATDALEAVGIEKEREAADGTGDPEAATLAAENAIAAGHWAAKVQALLNQAALQNG